MRFSITKHFKSCSISRGYCGITLVTLNIFWVQKYWWQVWLNRGTGSDGAVMYLCSWESSEWSEYHWTYCTPIECIMLSRLKPGIFNQCRSVSKPLGSTQNSFKNMPVRYLTSWWNQTIVNHLKNMIQKHVFLSVPKHYNPYSGNFAGSCIKSYHRL